MRVILEVRSGPTAGRKARLGPGQELRVGRTEWADFALPQDGRMSGMHFALVTDSRTCYVRDLGSSNGTLVNGQPVTETIALHNGDEILAGQTQFVVQIEADLLVGEPAAPVTGRTEIPVAVPVPPRLEPLPARMPTPEPSRIRAGYTVETCESGLTLCRGSVDEIPPAGVAGLLGQSFPLYFIVDFKRLGLPPPQAINQPEYLFDWLNAAAAALVSPIVFGSQDLPAWAELVNQGWGQDGVICLFSRREKPVLLEHLRRTCRAKEPRPGQSAAMLGYCWPSVMAILLAHQSRRQVEQMLSGIDAVLVEFPDLPETWQIYGSDQIPAILDRLELTRRQVGGK